MSPKMPAHAWLAYERTQFYRCRCGCSDRLQLLRCKPTWCCALTEPTCRLRVVVLLRSALTGEMQQQQQQQQCKMDCSNSSPAT
jgi:hypothetical protein